MGKAQLSLPDHRHQVPADVPSAGPCGIINQEAFLHPHLLFNCCALQMYEPSTCSRFNPGIT